LARKVHYLGYEVTGDVIRPHTRYIMGLRTMTAPTTKAEVRSAVGLFSYFRNFIPRYAKIAQPLLAVIKDSSATMTDKAAAAFRQLKSIMLDVFDKKKGLYLPDPASLGRETARVRQSPSDRLHLEIPKARRGKIRGRFRPTSLRRSLHLDRSPGDNICPTCATDAVVCFYGGRFVSCPSATSKLATSPGGRSQSPTPSRAYQRATQRIPCKNGLLMPANAATTRV